MTTNATPIEIPKLKLRFKSISACAKHFKVSWATVNYHLNNGTLDRIGASGRPQNNRHPITIDGVCYPSKTAAALALGICHQVFYRNLAAGKYNSPAEGD